MSTLCDLESPLLLHHVAMYRNKDIESLKKQIEMIKKGIVREEEKAYELEIKSRYDMTLQ